MIETKEQYEALIKLVTWEHGGGDELGGEDVRETIEALREVARATKSAIDAKDAKDKDYVGRIILALNALPDWIADG